MAMRNFWVNASIDGRQSQLCGGPRGREDGMYIEVRQRRNGESIPAVTVNCYVDVCNRLHTIVTNRQTGETVTDVITDR